MITVHITDDHKIFVEGMLLLLNEAQNITITGVSYNLEECRKALALETPDVLLLDLNLPDGSGIDFCSEIHTKYPEVKILILTTHNECSIARQVLKNGASGYVLKNSLSEEVIAGIETIMQGEVFLCDEIDILLKKRSNDQLRFTKREKELLRLLVEGNSNREMAEKMILSIDTVKTYRKHLMSKIGAKNTAMLVKMAIENKWA